jgi:predicted ArsR family transcriptional regulator
MAMTSAELMAAKVAKAKRRGERVRDELADALARGPTTAEDVREQIDVDLAEIRFQLDRMAAEGRAVEQGRGRFALASV